MNYCSCDILYVLNEEKGEESRKKEEETERGPEYAKYEGGGGGEENLWCHYIFLLPIKKGWGAFVVAL